MRDFYIFSNYTYCKKNRTKTVLNLWFRIFSPMIDSKISLTSKVVLFYGLSRNHFTSHTDRFLRPPNSASVSILFNSLISYGLAACDWNFSGHSLSSPESLTKLFFWNRSILHKLSPPNFEILDTFGWQVKNFRLNLRLTFD